MFLSPTALGIGDPLSSDSLHLKGNTSQETGSEDSIGEIFMGFNQSISHLMKTGEINASQRENLRRLTGDVMKKVQYYLGKKIIGNGEPIKIQHGEGLTVWRDNGTAMYGYSLVRPLFVDIGKFIDLIISDPIDTQHADDFVSVIQTMDRTGLKILCDRIIDIDSRRLNDNDKLDLSCIDQIGTAINSRLEELKIPLDGMQTTERWYMTDSGKHKINIPKL